MISKDTIVKLIERNPNIGRLTPLIDIRSIKYLYREIFNENHKEYGVVKRKVYPNTSCHPCITDMLNALRDYCGYPSLKKGLSKNLTKQRIEICILCEHSKGKGLLLTCGTPIIGQTIKEGELCGCFIHAKAAFTNESCPIDKWKNLT